MAELQLTLSRSTHSGEEWYLTSSPPFLLGDLSPCVNYFSIPTFTVFVGPAPVCFTSDPLSFFRVVLSCTTPCISTRLCLIIGSPNLVHLLSVASEWICCRGMLSVGVFHPPTPLLSSFRSLFVNDVPPIPTERSLRSSVARVVPLSCWHVRYYSPSPPAPHYSKPIDPLALVNSPTCPPCDDLCDTRAVYVPLV